MDFVSGYSDLSPDSDTITPLPPVLRDGLTVVAVLAFISLFTSSVLFIHLTFKLVRYSIKRARNKSRCRQLARGLDNHMRSSMDLNLGLNGLHLRGASRSYPSSLSAVELKDKLYGREEKRERRKEILPAPNQFVVLLYNLLLADMHQAVAFFFNVVWVARDGIFVRTNACFTQGLFISNGDLASSCFIATIALHTYLTVVRNYKPPEWALNAWIVGMWVFVYTMTLSGITSTDNGRMAGGYYVRATAWCWINVEFDNLRLITHYMYIFVALVLTPVTYTAIFLDLRRRLRDEALKSAREASTSPCNALRHKGSVLSAMSASAAKTRLGESVSFEHHPAFLIYPLIYVVCTLPLALGRVGTLANADVPYWYFCMAGALITSNGWLDVLLWGTTRHTVVFGPIEDADALGLETFAFMRTPPDREFGNIVWVQGATFGGGDESKGSQSGRRAGAAARRGRRWWAPVTLAVRRLFGGVESGVEDGDGQRGRSRRVGYNGRKGSGILGRLDMESAYRPDHVKDAADLEMGQVQPGGRRRELGRVDGPYTVTVKKDTFVTVEIGDLESGYSTPTRDPVRGHGRDSYFS